MRRRDLFVISSGIDSSVSVILLQKQVYYVVWINFLFGDLANVNETIWRDVKLLWNKLRGEISIKGIIKRLEKFCLLGYWVPVYINKNSEKLKIIQYLKDEAHRYGITFYRNKRWKAYINSELISIIGWERR